MEYRYITVLDFEISRVFQYKTDSLDVPIGEKIHEWCEEYLTTKGHNLSNCEWMEHNIKEIVFNGIVGKDRYEYVGECSVCGTSAPRIRTKYDY